MSNPLFMAANLLDPQDGLDPVAWAKEKVGFHLWSKQVEICNSLIDNKRTVVAACHAAGKTQLAAILTCWWLETNQPGQAFVVTTAPSWHQVRAILWRYINQLHARHGLRGRVNQTEWFMGGQLVGIGRKPADHDEGSFQGVHAPKVLVIIDEAGGVPDQLWTGAEAITTGDDCRILAIGNPDFPQGPFRQAFESPQWNAIRISAFDNPNFTDEVCPLDVRKNLVGRSWVDEAKGRWGETSPIYQSKVLGLFPDMSEDSVISYAHLVAAINREPIAPEKDEPTILGIDVAGGGTDMTVVRQRKGNRALKQWTTSQSDSEHLVEWILRIVAETDAKIIRIDSTGIGWGIAGSLREKCQDVNVVAINSSETPSAKRFLNARAEMWWSGRMRAEKGELDLSAAEDADVLLAQMSGPKWELNSKGKIKIESKDDLRTRTGRSPDNADALLLAFYDRWGIGIPEGDFGGVAKTKLTDRRTPGIIGQRAGQSRIPTARRIGQDRWSK